MDSILVGDYMRDWLTIRSATIRPRTREQYASAVRTVCQAVGDRGLSGLTPAACASVYAPIIAAGHERTAQIVYTVMSMAMRDAVAMGLLIVSPMAALHRPRHDARSILPFEPDEVAAILAADSDHRVVWQLLHGTGMRRGEACGLRWGDVDFALQCVRVRRQVVLADGVLTVSKPKSICGLREIPISAELAAALREHLCDQLARGRRGDFVVSRDGAMLHPYTLNRWLRDAAAAAGVSNAHPHRWRHTYGADGVSAGVDIRVLQRLLGHADIAVTARYYAYVRGDVLRTAAARIDDFRRVV